MVYLLAIVVMGISFSILLDKFEDYK